MGRPILVRRANKFQSRRQVAGRLPCVPRFRSYLVLKNLRQKVSATFIGVNGSRDAARLGWLLPMLSCSNAATSTSTSLPNLMCAIAKIISGQESGSAFQRWRWPRNYEILPTDARPSAANESGPRVAWRSLVKLGVARSLPQLPRKCRVLRRLQAFLQNREYACQITRDHRVRVEPEAGENSATVDAVLGVDLWP